MTAPLRSDLRHIADWITPASSVLDLGCGDGSLLAWLAANKQCRGYGVEIDVDSVTACVARGVDVIQSDMEAGLSTFEDNAFDFVVLSLTIQAMHNVEGILQEMLRVGRTGIVTFPNFGYWENRWQLLLGRMPVSETIPYEWYNTPNIHLCTVYDFERLLKKLGMWPTGQVVLHLGEKVDFLPNLLGSLALVRFERA
ncbi:methionine biosynthesis protein MetW [Chitiniphilus shinanonensis]|uniref:Methionine biosynthesis protein MetW n=1 Tax=Chitiniphilus shinanonensis TaxID=553088 RepID=A0ABQ6BYA1_9NEIS|nr:methionine biosynthesis protein MetW [Chitiniphilus shinanonensis]GLS06286.1 methionine biosynthesis protein MetW [Chitiniphilus shinanonensis]